MDVVARMSDYQEVRVVGQIARVGDSSIGGSGRLGRGRPAVIGRPEMVVGSGEVQAVGARA